ncbi:MAG: type II toxin-antitoxin system HicB family antitoxin [Coriobacteriales bacterium]|jgi:predicted DNA-binding protein|nr:type II toxin-antitoxin system HicB family antitoxin [Coriobacteriales bacterium]
MPTINTSIRMSEELFGRVKEEAAFSGVSLNAFIVELLAEKIQDEEDYHDAMTVLKEHNKSISREEMLKKYA